MTLESNVEKLLSLQNVKPIKLEEANQQYKKISEEVLISLDVKTDSQFYNLYTKYFLGSLEHRMGTPEMVDPCPPQGFEGAFMAHEVWKIPKNYILFTTGEGDGGYLYNIKDNSVWDFTLEQQKLLGTDNLTHWNSFYEFMVWYLTPEKDK